LFIKKVLFCYLILNKKYFYLKKLADALMLRLGLQDGGSGSDSSSNFN
jgi:hypothetical protein